METRLNICFCKNKLELKLQERTKQKHRLNQKCSNIETKCFMKIEGSQWKNWSRCCVLVISNLITSHIQKAIWQIMLPICLCFCFNLWSFVVLLTGIFDICFWRELQFSRTKTPRMNTPRRKIIQISNSHLFEKTIIIKTSIVIEVMGLRVNPLFTRHLVALQNYMLHMLLCKTTTVQNCQTFYENSNFRFNQCTP